MKSSDTPLRVQVLSMHGCAATPATIERVEEAAAALDVAIRLEHLVIATPAEAVAQRFLGSPSVRVEGLDVEPEARTIQDFGLT